MKKGLLVGIIGAALIIAAVVVFIVTHRAGEPETLRSIKVIELDGTCNIIRNGETIAAQKDMDLYTDDVVEVSEGSFAEIRLDDDKFLYLDENTIIDISATGDAETSDTMIFVEQGGMMTEVINKLSAESAFTIVTANTSMHITGTIVMVQTGENKLIAGEKAEMENGLIDVHDKKVTASNAILEGSAVVRAYSLDATGNQVLVGETTLSAGEGNSYTGSPVLNDGRKKALTEAEAGNGDGVEEDGPTLANGMGLNPYGGGSTGETSVFGAPEFDGEFLLRAQGVLGARTPHPNENEELSKRAREKRQMGLAWMDNIKAINGHNKIVLSSGDFNSAKVTADIKADSGEVGVIYGGQHSDSADVKAGTNTAKLDTDKKSAALQIENSRSKAEEEKVKVAKFSPVSEPVIDNPDWDISPAIPVPETFDPDELVNLVQEIFNPDIPGNLEPEIVNPDIPCHLTHVSFMGVEKNVIKNGIAMQLHLSFWLISDEGEYEENADYVLPKIMLRGDALPGIETKAGLPDVLIQVSDENAVNEDYIFTGWYSSAEAAETSNYQDQILTVPDTYDLEVYAGIIEKPESPVYDVSENDQMFAVSGND